MCIFFSSRSKARAFPSINGKVVDKGVDAPLGRRWAFEIYKDVK